MTEEQLESFLMTGFESVARSSPLMTDVLGHLQEGVTRNRSLPASRRKSGLRMAARDLLAMIAELTDEQREQLEGALYGRHGLSVARVRAAVAIDWTKVLKRGRLRNEEEYYAAKSLLDDDAHLGVSIDTADLERLVIGFEDDPASNVS